MADEDKSENDSSEAAHNAGVTSSASDEEAGPINENLFLDEDLGDLDDLSDLETN